MKYIDADKIVAEIERREFEIKSQIAELGNFESDEIGLFNYLDLYDDIRSFIDSLQQEQPEVDLEKEIENKWNKISVPGGDFDREMCLAFSGWNELARHFYELGLNARKEE